VYNSETLCVEESMHVKFDDKEPGNKTPEQGESFADMQVPEGTSEPDQTLESEKSPEAEPTSEELNQFQRNDVWDLVPKPQHKNIIGTKWVFKNKLNEQGEVVRNKVRLVAQGYSQQECIDYTETFAPVVRLKGIRLLLSFTVNHGIILYQMYV